MKCSLGISYFLEEISNLSNCIIFLYFFALITEEGFLISPCYSFKLCIQMGMSFLFSCVIHGILQTRILEWVAFRSSRGSSQPMDQTWVSCFAGWFFTFKLLVLQVSNPGFLGDSVVKNLPANAGDMGLIPGSGRFLGEGNGNPHQYSCLGNPMDRGAWKASELTKNQTQLSDWACTPHLRPSHLECLDIKTRALVFFFKG